MNWDRIEGNWKQLTGKVQEQWGKLTNDDLDVIRGNREQLVGRIQERYGITKDRAEEQIRDWETRYDDRWLSTSPSTGFSAAAATTAAAVGSAVNATTNSPTWDRVAGNWKQLKGKVKEQWGKLTDDDFDVVAGKRDQLAGRIQERYGITRAEADDQIRSWESRYQDSWVTPAAVAAGSAIGATAHSPTWDRVEGNWKQLKGKVKEQWGKLTDDDFDVAAGKRDQLAGRIQERYGITRAEADEQIRGWESRYDDSWTAPAASTAASRMVTGVFRDRQSAEAAYAEATRRGYTDKDIDLVMSDDTRKRHFDGIETELGTKAAEGAGVGAGIGGTIGAIAAAIAAAGTSLALPGLGLVIAGPLAAAAAGAGVGAASGGLIGALVGWSMPEERVKEYEDSIRDGGIVMGVRTRHDDDANALSRHWTDNRGEKVYF